MPVACQRRSGDGRATAPQRKKCREERTAAQAEGGGTHLSVRGACGREALGRTGQVKYTGSPWKEGRGEVKRTTPMAPTQPDPKMTESIFHVDWGREGG